MIFIFKTAELLSEIKKMNEQIREWLNKAAQQLRDSKYEDAAKSIASAQFVSDDIVSTITEMEKKVKK
jgi:CHASE3 domain sensor protein